MWRRPAVTIPMLIAVILTLPLRAQQKTVGPSSAGPRPNAVRPYGACAATALAPPGAQQRIVAPTLRSAHADLKVSSATQGFSPAVSTGINGSRNHQSERNQVLRASSARTR